METIDTLNLLRECDSGARMAISSITEAQDYVTSPKFYRLLAESKKHHKRLLEEIHALLQQYGSEENEPDFMSTMAKGMSWLKTNVKLSIDDSTTNIANLITDGCNMGIESLNEYLNQYTNANQSAKDICHHLITLEEILRKDLQAYL